MCSTAREDVRVLSKMLVLSVVLAKNYSVDDWIKIAGLYLHPLAEMSNLENLDELTSLAAILAIVGSRQRELFLFCFRLFSKFECIKGPYWAIQEEFVRHFLLSKLRTKIINDSLCDSSFVDKTLELAYCFYESHEILKLRLKELHDEFSGLVTNLCAQSNIELKLRALYYYEEKFLLSNFCEWFATWTYSKVDFQLYQETEQSISKETRNMQSPLIDAVDSWTQTQGIPEYDCGEAVSVVSGSSVVQLEPTEKTDDLSVFGRIRSVVTEYLDNS